MSEYEDGLSDYIRAVQENTQKYLRDLATENEKLCELIRSLEGHLDKERKERLHIEERIRVVEAERRSYQAQYHDVEAQNDNVSKLYAATLRLHGTISHADVLSAIHEIVINLVGSEEFAVFEMSPDGSELVRSSSFGLDAARVVPVPVGTGIIGACARSGESYVRGTSAEETPQKQVAREERLTACIPFVVERVVVGALAIFRLLGHKKQLEPIDIELFTLLGSHAATALYCTSVVELSGAPRSLRMRAAIDRR